MVFLKMPPGNSGTDLLAVRDFFEGCDMVIMEHVPLGFAGPSAIRENSCYSQFCELYGLFTGAGIPFYTIKPRAWQKLLNFPTKKEVEGEGENWKDFLADQARRRFPSVKTIPKYAGDAFLLYRVLTMLWSKPKEEWP